MPQQAQNPYTEFQTPTTTGDPYAEFQAPAQPVPQPQPTRQTFLERLRSMIPSTHTQFVTGGAGIGGTLGGAGGTIMGAPTILGTPLGTVSGAAVGGATGASIGESAYELGQWYARQHPHSRILQALFPPGELPATGTDVIGRQGSAMATGALQEGTGAVLSRSVPRALEQSALKSGTRAVGPSSAQEIRAGRDAMKTVVKDLPFARNMTQLLEKLNTNLTTEITDLDNLYNALPPSANIPGSNQRIIAGLSKLRDKFIERLPNGMYAPVKGSAPVVTAYDSMIREFQRPDLPIGQLRARRQVWDELVNWWRKDISRQPESESVFENTANLVRKEINQAYPQIAEKNARVSAWSDLRAIANESEPGAWGGGKRVPPSVLGAGVEVAAGRGTPSPYSAGHAVSFAAGPFRTAWRTATAPQKARIAEFLNRGMVQEAVRLLTRIGSAAGQEEFREPESALAAGEPIDNRQDALERLRSVGVGRAAGR